MIALFPYSDLVIIICSAGRGFRLSDGCFEHSTEPAITKKGKKKSFTGMEYIRATEITVCLSV